MEENYESEGEETIDSAEQTEEWQRVFQELLGMVIDLFAKFDCEVEDAESTTEFICDENQVWECDLTLKLKDRPIGFDIDRLVHHERIFDINCYAVVSDNETNPPGQLLAYILPGDVCKETYRLSTFAKFPRRSIVSVRQLAKQGFYYTGYSDRVKCYSCGRTVERWEASDSERDKRFHKANCLMVWGGAPDNIPIGKSKFIQDLYNLRLSRMAAALVGAPPRWRLASTISASHRKILENLYLNREIDRLASFAGWPINMPNVHPVELAAAGFFYLGNLDKTQCFSCGGVLRSWEKDDVALAEHRTHFANCRFVQGTDNSNVPIPKLPETHAQMTVNYPCQRPTNPHMRSEQARFATFDSRWPSVRTRATPEQIAEAGFFFLGERDRVKCWYCNGGLQYWEYDDIPWVEHAKWFPTCQFLLNCKGQHFAYRHLSVSPHLPRPFIRRQVGATIDPVEAGQPRGQYIPSQISRSRATPPSIIIDPQEEKRRRKEEVDKEIRENFGVRFVIDMGFAEEFVRKVLEERLEYLMSAEDQMDHIRTSIFDNTEQLLNAIQERDAKIKRELAEKPTSSGTIPVEPVDMRRYAQRLSSFDGRWQRTTKATPQDLANAGFYHTGEADHMKCFSCGLVLRHWKKDDDPWTEHAKWFPSCSHLISKKGDEFIQSVADKFPDLKRPKLLPSSSQSSEALNEEGRCKICYSEAANMVFVPCCHLCCCSSCSTSLQHCPVCRKKIDKTLKIYQC